MSRNRDSDRVALAFLSSALMTVALAGCASGSTDNTSPTTTDTVAVVTAVGTPDGQAATASIGPAGGSLPSADGRLTVIVPPGAVTSNTTFSVQPITNQAPGGIGDGYRLGPNGQTFSTPVQLRFQYTDDDLAGTVPDVLGIAYQDAQGYWNELLSGTYDQVGKTLTVGTTHFTDWVTMSGAQLTPRSGAIRVGTSIGLSVRFCSNVPKGGTEARLASCQTDAVVPGSWSVIGQPGGNSSYGTISGGATGATYKAPAQVPPFNPVAISATVGNLGTRNTGRSIQDIVANITVYDESWSGPVSFKNAAQTGDGQIMWVESSREGNSVVYRPTGTVTVTLLDPDCSFSPSQHTLDPNSETGILRVNNDVDGNPVSYYGSAGSTWTGTYTCNGTSAPGPISVFYFSAFSGGSVTKVGNTYTITGETPSGSADRTTWTFTRNH